jgi:hypothetical protein
MLPTSINSWIRRNRKVAKEDLWLNLILRRSNSCLSCFKPRSNLFLPKMLLAESNLEVMLRTKQLVKSMLLLFLLPWESNLEEML